MVDQLAFGEAKEVTFSATIIRADGSTEELGVVSYWHKNIFKRILWSIKQWLHF
jgi:hypothetical protein